MTESDIVLLCKLQDFIIFVSFHDQLFTLTKSNHGHIFQKEKVTVNIFSSFLQRVKATETALILQ